MSQDSLNQVAALAAKTSEEKALVPITPDERAFALVQRQATMYSSADIVPDAYKGKTKIGNCVIAMEMAHRMGIGVLEVMQNLHIIHGKGMWSGQFVIARINNSGLLKGRLRFEYERDGDKILSCRAYGFERESGERIDGTKVTWEMAEKDGWTRRTGSKWLTMPEQMFPYRAATFFARVHAPELLGGLPAEGEIEDSGHIDGQFQVIPPGADRPLTDGQRDSMTRPFAEPIVTQEEQDALLNGNPDPSAPAVTPASGLEPADGESGGDASPQSGERRGKPSGRRGGKDSAPTPPPAAGDAPHPGPDQDAGGGASSHAPDGPITPEQKEVIKGLTTHLKEQTNTDYINFCKQMFGTAEDDYDQYSEAEAAQAIAWLMDRRAAARAAK